MSADDPLGLMGQMIGQFRVGRVVPQARSGLLYSGWDLTRSSGGTPTAVWLHILDRKRSRRADLVRVQADAWRAFRHPAFIPIVGCETLPGERAIIGMDVPDGVLLSERLAAAPLALVEATKMALLLCEALVEAHRHGLVNLALSEESIILPKHESGGPRFFGCGIATVFERPDSELWHYLAPEQLMSQDCDQRADVYALGVLLFRSLTGHYPIEIDSAAPDRIAQLITNERRDPRRWLGTNAEPIAKIIEHCLQPNRNDRFQSSTALAQALRSSGVLLTEVDREQSDPKGIVLTPPPVRAPEKRSTAENETLSPTPAPEIIAAVAARSTTADRPPASIGPGRAAAPKPIETDLIGYQLKELRVESRFAEGGMSELYLARHIRLPRTWIVKVASAEFAKRASEWFEQEAHVTALLRQHRVPRVVEVIDCDWLPDGRPYMVMEFIHGTALDKLLATPRALPIDDCVKIIDRAAEALELAHDLGIVHRDIKPPNTMLEERNGRRTNAVYVLDWGVSRAAGEDKRKVTDVGAVVGTPGYMAPEQSLADYIDGRADVFSLATMMYEMLAGRPAFEGRDRTQIIIAANTVHPPRLTEIRPEVHKQLSECVAAGMIKDRDRRPDMRTFRAMLRSYSEGVTYNRPAGAPSPLSTNISTANPVSVLPLARRPTLAAVNAEKQEMRMRAIEPERTVPLRSATPHRTGPVRPAVLFGLIAAGTAAAMAVIIWFALRGSSHPAATTTSGRQEHAQTPTAPPRRAPIAPPSTAPQAASPARSSTAEMPSEEVSESLPPRRKRKRPPAATDRKPSPMAPANDDGIFNQFGDETSK